MNLVIEPEAEAEIVEAAVWYDEQAKVLRESSLNAVAAALDVIGEHPSQYHAVFGKVRRVMVKGFPYALLYVASDLEVSVLACFHSSRNPKRWQGRLPR